MSRSLLRQALATVIAAASIIIVAPVSEVFAAPVPSVSISPAPLTGMVGEPVTFSLTFDNTSAIDVGYGPYVDLLLPIGGADGNDGVTFTSATYLGAAMVPRLTTTCTGANVTHPLTGLSILCPTGRQLVVLQLPFGSFTASQPPAPIQVTAAVSDLADVGTALPVAATPGFAYGTSAIGNTPIIGTATTTTFTPQVVRFTKTYIGPENETATGPNYPRRFRLSVDVATGQQVNSLAITDLLPPQYAFVAVTAIGPAGSSSTQTPTVGSPALSPNNDLVRTWTGPITGTAASEDLFVEFEYFIPDLDANGVQVVDHLSGDDHVTRNDGKVSGTVHPKDVRDPDAPFTIDPNVLSGTNVDDVQMTAKSIAIQKSVAIQTDTGASGASPGDVLQYTLTGQVSDYFTFAGITLADVLGDGQSYVAGYTPTLVVTENGSSTSTTMAGNASVDESARTTCGDGTTALGFDVSNAYSASGALDGAGGIFTGGRVSAATGPATFTITYRTTIDDRYKCAPSANDALDPNDHVDNTVLVTGEVYDNLTQAPQTLPMYESDGSGTSVTIRNAALSKSIYARNGVIGGASGSPAQFAAGDAITYRLHFDMPSTDITALTLSDYLPLPVLVATGLSHTAGVCTTPAVGEWCFGPADAFHTLPAAPTPTVAADSVGNSITWSYGTYDDPLNQPTTIELLFTLQISDSPFRDGLFLTNQVQATYNNSFGVQQTTPAIVQIELTEPNLRILKGAVDSDSPNETYTGTRNPTGVTFGGVGSSCPGFSPSTLTSAKLNNAPNANVSRVDADDIVRFAIVVENTGRGLNGAFDVAISDTMPAGFSIPASGLKLCVTDGLGTAKGHVDTGFFTGSPTSGPNTGTITLNDGPTLGALTPDNALHSTGTNLAVISYELQLQPTTPFQTVFTNTAAVSHFASTEGGPDFTPLLPAASKTDIATATSSTPSVAKVLTSTNQAHTAGNTVVVGEVATYTVTVTVPEGAAANARLVDTLPTGLALVSVDSITASAALTSSVGSMATVLSTTQATLTAPGRPLTVSFGTLTNGDTDDNVAEKIVIVCQAVVLDVAGNQLATAVNNSAKFTYTGGNSNTATAGLVVAEPVLDVSKSVSPTNADAGDTVTYTLLVHHTAASNATAFDVALSDLVPTGVNYVPSSLTFSGTAPTTLSDAAAPTITGSWASFPVGASTTITFQATLPLSATAPSSITNTAGLKWTSLPAGGDPTSPYNVDGRERTGAGGVDDYADTGSATVAITPAAVVKTLVTTSASHTTAADVTIGETATFDILATLPEGSIPSGFTVIDLLPNGLRYVAGSAQVITTAGGGSPASSLATSFNGTLPAPVITGGASDGDDVVLTFGATSVVANNDSADNSFVVRLTAVVSDISSNVGTLPGQTKLDNVARVQLVGGAAVDSNVVRVAVVEPHMDIAKSVSPTAASQGDPVTVTFTVKNNGLADAFDVSVQDVLDAAYDAATVAEVTTPSGFSYSRIGSTITYSGGSLATGSSISFVITVDLVASLPPGTSVPNTATVTDATTLPGAVTGERNEPDAASTAILNVVGPDLNLSKDDGITTVIPGQDTTYQLIVTNTGGFQATGVYIDDVLPPGTSLVSIGGARCSDGGAAPLGARRILISGIIAAAGDSVTCTLTLHVTAPAAAGTAGYLNSATVVDDGVNGPDPTPDNNVNDDTDTLVGHHPDLRVTKNDGVQTRAPGETYTYTIDVSNHGNIGATNVKVTDTLPAGLAFVSCSSTSGSVLVACTESGGVVTITYAGLAGAGGSASFQITVQVDNPVAAAIDQLVNRVTVVDDGANGTDANPADNLDSDTDSLDAAPDLVVLKSVSTSEATPGDVLSYSLQISNAGLQDATGTTVTDVAPAGLTIQCGSASPAATSCDGTTIIWGPGLGTSGATTGGTFYSGTSRTLTYDASVDDPAAAGATQLENTAGVADDGDNGIDPTPENNIDTAVVGLVGVAPDLSVTKSDGVSAVQPGDLLTYTIDATNSGNIGASSVIITDTLPTELVFVSCPLTPVPCDASALPVITWTLPTLVGGGTVATVTYDATVVDPLPAGIESYDNLVTVTDDGTNGPDPTPGDNAYTDTDAVSAAPDLDVVKNDGIQSRSPGDEYDYTLTVHNKGDQDATGVSVADTLPAELAFVSCPNTPVGCTASGESTGGAVTWILGDVGGATTTILTVHVRVADGVAATVTQIHNSVVVADDATNGPDPTPDDNFDTDDDMLSVAPDMAISKTDGVTSARPGDSLTYSVTVRNNGAQAATGVTVHDVLPTGVTFVSCSGGCDSSALPTLTWTDLMESTPGSISDPTGFDPDGSRVLTITVTVDDPAASGIDSIVNDVDVADDGANGADPTPLDNFASDTDILDVTPDLVVTKDDGVAAVSGGDTVDYSITVTNVGRQDAQGVTVTDTLPAGLSVVSCSLVCDQSDAPVVVWTVGSLGAGQTVVLHLVVAVDVPVAAGTTGFLNTVTAADDGANGPDPTPDDNTATDLDTYGVDLAVTKSDGITEAVPGEVVDYTITVTNLGPSTISTFTLLDTLPVELLDVTFTPSIGDYDHLTGLWTGIGSFAQDDIVTLHVRGSIDASATGQLVNTVSVDPPLGFPDPNPDDNVATDIDTLTPHATLLLQKDLMTPLVTGGSATYRMTVTNSGPSMASDVSVTDPLPASLTPTAASGVGWTCNVAGQTVGCSLDTPLAPGSSASFEVTATVHAGPGSSVVNTATAVSSTPTPGGQVAGAVDSATGSVDPSLPATGGTIGMLWRALQMLVLGFGLLLLRRTRPRRM